MSKAKDRKSWAPELQEAYNAASEAIRAYDFDIKNYEGKGAELRNLLIGDMDRRLTKLHEATEKRTGLEYTSGRFLDIPGTNLQKSGGFGGQAGAPDVEYTKLGRAEAVTKAAREFLEKAEDLDQDIKTHRRDLSQEGTVLSDEEWEQWVKNRAKDLDLDPNIFRRNAGSRRNALDVKDLQSRLSATVNSVETRAEEASDFVEEIRVIETENNNVQRIVREGVSGGQGLRGDNLGKFLSDEGLKEFNELYEGEIPEEAPAIAQILNREISQEQIRRDSIDETDPTNFASRDDVALREGIELADRESEAFVPEEGALIPEMEAAAIETGQEELQFEQSLAEAEFGVGGEASGRPAVDGAPGGEPSDGPPTPEGFNAQLDAIGDTFDVASQFGYRFFFFKPGTDEPREDMMISDQVILDRLGLDAPINVLQYIKDEGLTNPREIEAAFAETEWYANTNETMQQFDLDWDAAAASGSLNDDFTLRRREIVKTELDYISGQLEALGLGDEMTEAQQLALAKTAKRTGMSLQDIRQTLSSVELDFATFTGADGAGTGLLGSYETSIKNMASQYMIGIDEKSLDDYVLGVYQSDDPEQNMLMLKEQLAETAKSRFPTLGGLIDRGMTPAQYFAPYSSKASALLERPVDFMGADEGLFNQIASGMPDNETGSRTMTFTESNELIRGTAEWQTTKNANDEARTIADDVGRMFGFVA